MPPRVKYRHPPSYMTYDTRNSTAPPDANIITVWLSHMITQSLTVTTQEAVDECVQRAESDGRPYVEEELKRQVMESLEVHPQIKNEIRDNRGRMHDLWGRWYYSKEYSFGQ